MNLVSLDPSDNPYSGNASAQLPEQQAGSDGLPVTTGVAAPAATKGIMESALDSTENAVAGVYNGTKSVLSTVASDVGAGLTKVADGVSGVIQKDVLDPAKSTLSFGTTQIVLLVVALGFGLYLVGKGGLKIPG